ncbi:MAG: hypothetical protein PHX77_03415 [Candidatus Bipolaricaulis sp.]|nr:hypothetical protein [Candidatus Bipolaricaulis sp.]MDD5646162.1 hypothetical protein [Candidatus Bipolaricaulis sp.]
MKTRNRETDRRGTALAVGLMAAVVAAGVVWAEGDSLQSIQSEIVPAAGTATAYGIPLSLGSLPLFIGWWTTSVPAAQDDPRYVEALSALVAPCCDDNTAFHCCCESEEGQACNIIRSAKGLAAHLVLDLDYPADQVRDSVFEWLRFARWDYYVAREMVARGIDPSLYGLTVEGSCYRGLCGTPISQGGCGGMQELLETSIEALES